MIGERRHSSRTSGSGLRSQGSCVALAFALAILFPRAAAASETQWWILDSAGDYAKSEARGVVVGWDGALELGPRTSSSVADSLNTIWAIAVLKDGSVAIGGERGRIDRWTESGGIRPWVKLPVGQVLSLAADSDGLMAGTGPEGSIYHVSARGDTSLVVRTGERYVWALARGRGSDWFAATGTKGRLFRISAGHARLVLDSDESNLVSMISDGAGGVYTGGDSKGRIINVRADGTVRTVYDAPEDEVRALTLGRDGALYAAALTASPVTEEKEESSEETAPAPATTPTPAPTKTAVSGGKSTVYRIVPDSTASVYWSAPQPFVYGLVTIDRGVVAVTGNRAGIYVIERPNRAVQWLAASQGQITGVAVDARGHLFAAGSNPGALWRLGPERAERGELLSQALDARRTARFGRIRWRGEPRGSHVEIRTRSGNTDEPDTTWSDWKGGAIDPEGLRMASPPARYLQWKITLSGGNPRIESVEAAWREENLPPRVEDLIVAPQGQGFREGELLPRSESVTQSLPGGQKVEYSLSPTTTPSMLRSLPMWARGIRTVQWKGSDPNGDPLHYRIDVRAEGGGPWIKVVENLDAPTYSWDTNGLPDGRYRLRVTASDQQSNAVGEERTDEALSEPFTVDNTPPLVSALNAKDEGSRVRVSGRVEDAFGPMSRIEVSLDDGIWRTVTPEGGLADDKSLTFNAVLDASPGEHSVSIRAADLAGNVATRAIHVTVTHRR